MANHKAAPVSAMVTAARTAAAAQVDLQDAEPPSATVAFARIHAWHEALRAIAGVAEAQIMAACWAIRRDIPDHETFKLAIERNLAGILQPDRAWAMAETWDVARRQRSLRALAMDNPDGAIAFVRELAEEAGAEHVRALDEDDREVAELLSAPPRKRREQLRAMVRMRRGAPPIEEPADRRAARVPPGWAAAHPATPEPSPSPLPLESSPDGVMAELQAIGSRLHGLANAVGETSDSWSPAYRDRLLRLTDMIMGDLERIAEFAHGDRGRAE